MMLSPKSPWFPSHIAASSQQNVTPPSQEVDKSKTPTNLLPHMDRPLVWQVYQGGMRRDEYLKWVHRSHRPRAAEQGCRMFETPWLERASKTPWWVVPAVWLPVSLGCMTFYAASPEASILRGAGLGICGVALWSMLEYGLHRFVFHCDEHLPDHPASITGHFIFHGIHHKLPSDPLRLVMPPAGTALIAGAVLTGMRVGLWWLPGADVAAAFGATLASYVGYDLTHYALHHTRPRPTTFLARRQRYHRRHHAENREVRGFGVTFAFWDKMFGTSYA